MDFGYLPQSDLETGNLRTDDQLRDAIRTLQVSGPIFVFLCAQFCAYQVCIILRFGRLQVCGPYLYSSD